MHSLSFYLVLDKRKLKMQKPLLPNDFKIKDFSIKNQAFSAFDFEIYILKNAKKPFFNLIKNKANLKNEAKIQYKPFEFHFSGKSYIAFFSDTNLKYDYQTLFEKVRKPKQEGSGLDRIAGMNELKAQLTNEIINPLKEPQKYEKFKISLPNGYLFYGPPGCGKTYIARALAEEMGYEFMEISGSSIASIYIHGSVEKIGATFREAREKAPVLLFIDELDAFLPNRDNSKEHKVEEINEFLIHLNNASKEKILVIGATNRIQGLDKAATRSGRFDKKILIDLPDFLARKALFEFYLKDRPCEPNMDIEELSLLAEGLNAADITLACDDGARLAISKNMDFISKANLIQSIQNIKSQLPDFFARKALFECYLKDKSCDSNMDIEELSLLAEGLNAADIALACDDGARLAISKNMDCITMALLKESINNLKNKDPHFKNM